MKIASEKQNRIAYADILRTLAIFAVVMIHLSVERWYKTLGSFEWEVLNVYQSMARWCVPIFIMVSGMFFLDPKRNVTYTKLFRKYIPRIIGVLVFWGIAYNIFNFNNPTLVQENGYALWAVIRELSLKLILGPPWFHLWFLYTIIGLYLITPALRLFISVAHERDLRYILWLVFILGTALKLFNHFSADPIIGVAPEFASYVGYFLAGYYFSKYDLPIARRRLLYFLGLISVFLTIILTSHLSHTKGYADDYFYDYLLPTTMLSAYALFIFLKNPRNSKNNVILRIFRFPHWAAISGCCFGIYLIHDFFNQFLKMVGIGTELFNPLLSVPVFSLGVFTVSLLIILLVKRIPILRDWIV